MVKNGEENASRGVDSLGVRKKKKKKKTKKKRAQRSGRKQSGKGGPPGEKRNNPKYFDRPISFQVISAVRGSSRAAKKGACHEIWAHMFSGGCSRPRVCG